MPAVSFSRRFAFGSPAPSSPAPPLSSSPAPPLSSSPALQLPRSPASSTSHRGDRTGIYWPGSTEGDLMMPLIRRTCRVITLLALALILMPAAAYAQFDTATVLGSVRDASGS